MATDGRTACYPGVPSEPGATVRLCWPLLALACQREPSPSRSPSGPSVLAASCAETDHPLRFSCTASLSAAEPATWTVTDSAGRVRTFPSDGSAEIVTGVWGLAPDTDFDWQLATASGGEASGSFRTGSLPDELTQLELVTVGSPVELDHFVVPYRCRGGPGSGLILFGTDGVVRWYEPFRTGSGIGPSVGLTAFDWSERDEIAVVLDGDRVVRLDPMGQVRFEKQDFERPMHHDVGWHNDHIVALHAYVRDDRVLDGLYVIDERGELAATWSLHEHVEVTGHGGGGVYWTGIWPLATDWSHGNAITSDGTHGLLSLRWQSAVLRIALDPSAPDFGEVDWMLTGSDANLPGDFSWPDGGGFLGQHHASRRAEGGLALFDNGPVGADSRVLFVALDEEQRTASEAASWSVGEHCEVQGGAYPLPGGGAFATCSTAGRVYEFVSGQAEPVWGAEVTCAGEPVSGLNRARPVRLP